MTDEERDKILLELQKNTNKTNEEVVKIKTALVGYDGTDGICGDIEKHTAQIGKIIIALAFMAGSTGIGFGLVSWLA